MIDAAAVSAMADIPNEAQARLWTERVWGERQGWAIFAFGIGGHYNGAGTYEFDRFEQRYCRWPQDGDRFVAEALRRAGDDDVFVGPYLRSSPQRKRGSALPSRALYADVDSLDGVAGFERTLIGPHGLLVDSGHGVHPYLVLDRELEPPELEHWNRRLAARLEADAGWSETKFLRLPGTINHKQRALCGNPLSVRLVDFKPLSWDLTLDELDMLLPNADALPLRWYLNEGLVLPRDLERLRATIEQEGFGLAVLDSFYNIAGAADLKDREAGQLFAALKAEVADPTGCTVLVVDHMPWATDQNRARLRAYGDVFKGAAVRFGIYVDAERGKLYVEARGNNIRGFKRTQAYWDAERLELRLIDAERVAEEEIEGRVAAFLEAHPGSTRTEIEARVTGAGERIRAAIERMITDGRLTSVAGTGRKSRATYLYPASQAGLTSVFDLETEVDGCPSESPQSGHPSFRPSPYRGTDVRGTEVKDRAAPPPTPRAHAREGRP